MNSKSLILPLVLILVFSSVGFAADTITKSTDKATTDETSDYIAIPKGSLDTIRQQIAETEKELKLYIEERTENVRRDMIDNDDKNTQTVYEKLKLMEQEMVFLNDPVRSNIIIFLFTIALFFGLLWLIAVNKTRDWLRKRVYANKVVTLVDETEKMKEKTMKLKALMDEMEEVSGKPVDQIISEYKLKKEEETAKKKENKRRIPLPKLTKRKKKTPFVTTDKDDIQVM